MYNAYKAKQSNLNDLGVTELALVAIATHRAGTQGDFVYEALEVLMEITMAGNPSAQRSLAKHVQLVDRDGRVWNHMKDRIMMHKKVLYVHRRGLVLELGPLVRLT